MKIFESLILAISLILGAFCLAGCSQTRIPAKEVTAHWSPENSKSAVNFNENYNESVNLALTENKPLLLFFWEPNCVFSNKMLENTFSDKKIASLAQNFICVRVDINSEKSKNICKQFNVKGSPTVQFISSQGRPLQQITQNQPPEVLKQQMEMVLHSIAWRESQTLIR